MGEVDAVIPDKSDSSESISAAATTTAATAVVINGELNGICSISSSKTDEASAAMEVDTEEDSQISSENGISLVNEKESVTKPTLTTTATEKCINKENLLVNNIECSINNSNSSNSTSTNNDSSSNTKENLINEVISPPPASTTETSVVSDGGVTPNESSKNITEETSVSSMIEENSQNTADSCSEESSSKANGSVERKIIEIEQTEEIKPQSTTTTPTDSTIENKVSIKNNEKNAISISGNDDNKMKIEGCSLVSSQNTNNKELLHKSESNNEKQESNDVLLNDSETNVKKDITTNQSSSNDKNVVESEETVTKDRKNEETIVPMEEDSSLTKSLNTAVSNAIVSNNNSSKIEDKEMKINEDDGAVVIPSDSESDQESNTKIDDKKANENIKKQQNKSDLKEKESEITSAKVVDDDVVVLSDKDDCVVIEDDDKKETSNTSTVRRTTRQRKSVVKARDFSAFDDDDEPEIVDESQPPSKRSRTDSQPVGQIGQITIKDARSLMPTPAIDPLKQQQNFNQTSFPQGNTGGVNNKTTKEPTLVIIDTNLGIQQHKTGVSNQSSMAANKSGTAFLPIGMSPQSVSSGVFPVNIRPAGLSQIPITTSPKMMNAAITPLTQPMQDASSILPNLTDDMFVLEAPSFIVPYIYEKPPPENLKEVVTKLSAEVEIGKKDSKDKDCENEKSEEQSVEGKSSNSNENITDSKKDKRRRKKAKNPDDSWGESDESTDDDASDVETRTKILIKDVKNNDITKIVTNTEALKQSILGSGNDGDKKTENYFDSPLGKFFIDIGIGLVQEYVQADLLRQQKRKRDKARGNSTAEIERAINSLKQNLQDSKKRNEPFKFEMKRCEYCNFKSESALAMAHHYETPHMRQCVYKCNFCSFEVRPPHDILFHMEAVHNIKGRLEKAPSYHQCPNCPFEDNGKSKLARHLPVCAKKFRPEQNLLPPSDWEAPAKIPRIKPRHGLVGTATAYQAMAAQAAAQKAALASLTQRGLTPNNNASNAFMRNRGRPQGNAGRPPAPVVPTNTRVRQVSPSGVVMPNVHMTGGGQFIQVSSSNLAVLPNSLNVLTLQSQQNSKKSGNGQPSISITPLPRQPNNQTTPNPMSIQPSTISAAAGSKSTPTVLKPGQGPSSGSSAGNKASFVICEICDGYIKDLEQLRNHMQWMHKVKIHPKMIYNRPPLNCQKCQFRFFTDQGLERHLLGSHGLVTSSMQEAANKGKDAGRCPVCGRMYQWKLLNHVSRDHHMTLKPAHLSYKCTVCTATFGMYKQFENHVYTAHSTVAKNAMDNKKSGSSNNNSMGNSSNSGQTTTNQRGSLSGVSNFSSLTGNDPLLKPLKINDEITIIPQPASKSRGAVNEIESHIIGDGMSSSSSFSDNINNRANKKFDITIHNDNIIEEISDDDEDSDCITVPNGIKKKIWSVEETKYLIECYKKYRHVLEQRTFKKDDLWLFINQEMNNAGFRNSPNQAKFKFDKLKRAYIKVKRRIRSAKYKPREFRFMDEFDELFA